MAGLRALTAALVAVAAAAACSPFVPLNLATPSGGYELIEDVAYGAMPRQRLDLYRPAGAGEPLKVVVFFYGGSWKWGDRGDYRFAGEALASRGWLAVVPDYRVYPDARFPDFVEDGALALRWVKDNIAGQGGDPAQVWLVGHSAGGHIAQMLTLDRRYLEAVGLEPADVRGTAALAAPAAFDPLRYASVRPVFAGMADPEQARPIIHVDGDEPPLLLLHGDADGTVLPSNSAELAARIREAGGQVRHVVYPGMGHLGILLALAAPFRHGEGGAVLDDIARFIEGG